MARKFNHGHCFRKAFECNCIKLLVSAYQKAINENSVDLNWEENDITAQLREYIDLNPFRIEKHIVADVEAVLADNSSPKEKGYATKYSRIDMKFVVFRNRLEYKYFAEAKLLREHDNKLKQRYIKTGIDNFITGKYYDGCLICTSQDKI
jgi:hypothetical protein